MTSADEYSLLDSGRIGSAYNPMDLARSSRPRTDTGAAQPDGGLDAREPPSLELIAEMIKEEIRQASSLKKALDRVNVETESMSQRVSNLSVSDAADSTDPPASPGRPGSGGSRQENNGRKPAKRVQFTVPDDIRFRWLGIFQQSSDAETSDGEGPGEAPQPTRAESASSHVAGMHALNPPGVAVGQSAAQSGPRDLDAATRTAPVGPPAQEPAAAAEDSARPALPLGAELTESDSGSQPFTTNSSLEAVYSGSRYDTRGSAASHVAQTQTATPGLPAPARPIDAEYAPGKRDGAGAIDADENKRRRAANGTGEDALKARLAYLLESRNHAPNAGSSNRQAGRHNAPNGRPSNGSRPFALDRRDKTAGAFSKPSLTTSRVTVSKGQASILPPTQPPQPSPHLASAALLWPHLQNVRYDRLRDPASSHVADGAKAHRKAPPLQRSESVRMLNIPPAATAAAAADALHRRGSSFDGSSISSRGGGGGGLAARPDDSADAGAGESDYCDAKPPPAHSGPHAGLLRRVTVSSVHRQGHQPRAPHGEHGGGILGGTRDFLKQRLRPRTHSSSPHPELSEYEVQDTPGDAAEARGGRAKGAGHQPRPRRRSDAEVKSRGPASQQPSPPAIPDHLQQRCCSPLAPAAPMAGTYIGGCVAAGDNATAGSMPLPYAPQPMADRQSDWVAVSPPPSSSVHNDGTTLRPDNPPASTQRRSHDDGAWAHPRFAHREAAHERAVPKQALQHPPMFVSHLVSPSSPLLSPRGYSERASPDDQSLTERSSDSTDSPPLPGLPHLPPLPPDSPPLPLKDLHKAGAKQAAGENDSIDYHMRRLKDRKSRRSSFMTTIGHMLGRKD
ncbi:hypothetical protein LPJ61_003513 [Coemansia biformis]|uniref:Uncharacterized protein n=1 Tax=Coemansia biformis TaxID=1286918 RepID=A0A9W7Y6F8_9FUNG|nr:hypothetical protein LPJ61_003513 [Coemansia biformis]